MICQRCQNPIHIVSPFCPVCRAEPVLGCDWLATAWLHLDDNGVPVVPEGDGQNGHGIPDLRRHLFFWSCLIAAAEADAAAALVHRLESVDQEEAGPGPAADDQADGPGEMDCEQVEEQALERVGAVAPLLQEAIGTFLRSAENDALPHEEVLGDLEFKWVLDQYGAYVQRPEGRLEEDYLRDVLQRRTTILLSRAGYTDLCTFDAPNGCCSVTYDRLALAPLPVEDEATRHALAQEIGGYEGSFGELQLALIPAAWRGPGDLVMAPHAGLAVFFRPNTPVSLEDRDPDWDGDLGGACRHYATWLGGDEVDPGDVYPSRICGLPAVRYSIFLQESDTYLHHDVAWVKAPHGIYYLNAWVPDQHPELVRAIHGAFAGFHPAGFTPARDAALGPVDAR